MVSDKGPVATQPAASDDLDRRSTPAGPSAQLAASVLDFEAEREAAQRASHEQVVFADELLPGVGDPEISLRDGLQVGGTAIFFVLMALVALDELEGATLGVLAPDIRDAF